MRHSFTIILVICSLSTLAQTVHSIPRIHKGDVYRTKTIWIEWNKMETPDSVRLQFQDTTRADTSFTIFFKSDAPSGYDWGQMHRQDLHDLIWGLQIALFEDKTGNELYIPISRDRSVWLMRRQNSEVIIANVGKAMYHFKAKEAKKLIEAIGSRFPR